MAQQTSLYWDTAGGIGDGADTYGAVQNREFFTAAFQTDRYAAEGVLAGVTNQLAVIGSATPLTVTTGAAYVKGIFYVNTANVSVAVPTPSGGTTGHRVVLQADFSARTVRVALISSADGVSSYPALTQQDNSRYEILLANLSIDTGGTITVTDARDYCHFSAALVYRRRGGSRDSWNTAGSSSYTPGATKRQGGVITLVWDDNDSSDAKRVTFPSAYSQKPIVRVTVLNGGDSTKRKFLATVESVSTASCEIRGQRTDSSSDLTTTCDVQWVAIGPE